MLSKCLLLACLGFHATLASAAWICPLRTDFAGAGDCNLFGTPYSGDELPAVFTVDRDGTPACPGASELFVIADAARAWSSVEGSAFSFGFGGFEERAVGHLFFGDGVQHLKFKALDVGQIAKVWVYGPPGREADAAFTLDDLWDCGGGELSLMAIALHQLGHALGLGHSSDPESVMNLIVINEELADSDEACLRELYPGE
ncbi:MAG: hypothetical protein CME06_17405 [Gemmatimonadetes bacterium]|nr:hypothetical protein [Gemmatimonadota bacterium]